MAEDVVNGENVKQSLKKNLKQGASSAIKDVARIGVNQIKRKLDEELVASAPPKNRKIEKTGLKSATHKNRKKPRKIKKSQTGSGLGGTIFD